MDTAKVFMHGRSQAVRLPKAYRFDADEVAVSRLGDLVILCPRDKAWEAMERGIAGFTDDALADRDQPAEPDNRPSL